MGSKNISTFYTSSLKWRRKMFLQKAAAPVWSRNLSVPANILLDKGSQKTFVTEKLELRLIGTANLSSFGRKNEQEILRAIFISN